MRKTYLIAIAAVFAVSMLLLPTAVAEAPVTGAIFTTLEDGTRVNANHYDDKRDVYLDGGPGPNAPQEAAGLPDGNYYFQVTDPSGKKLLSEDAVKCREFRVEDGVIAEYLAKTRTYTLKGKEYACYEDGWEYGLHDLGWDTDHDALTVQLMPYKDTPNPGGVYKAWATPTEDFDGDPEKVDNGYSPGYFHGFIPKYSKTDNFKVKEEKETPQLELCKFEDLDGNGKWDTGEPALEGWAFYVTDTLDVRNVYYSDENGCVLIVGLIDGYYTIEEEMPEGWIVTATIVNGDSITPTDTVTIQVKKKDSLSYSVTFGNLKSGKICGLKWYDFNRNGKKDATEVTIEGFKIEIYKNGYLYSTETTDENGEYCFEDLGPGDYTIKEVMPNNPGDYWMWRQTYPEGNWVYTDLKSGFEIDDADFGNVIEFKGGKHRCYWKTHAGLDGDPRDPTYDLLPSNPMKVDILTADDDYWVENEEEAVWILGGAGGVPHHCVGDCRDAFRAQLMTLHMNLLKFDGMDKAVYVHTGDPYSGKTVEEIYDAALAMLLDGNPHDFTSFHATLVSINENGYKDPGDYVLVMKDPPIPDYS